MIAFAFSFTITSVGYTAIMPAMWATADWTDPLVVIYQIWFIYCHTVPLATATINTVFFTDTIGYIIDIWTVPLIAGAYCLMSYIHYLLTGLYPYPFLNWGQWDSLGAAAGVSAATTLWYAVFVELT